MYKITIENENGTTTTFENVLVAFMEEWIFRSSHFTVPELLPY